MTLCKETDRHYGHFMFLQSSYFDSLYSFLIQYLYPKYQKKRKEKSIYFLDFIYENLTKKTLICLKTSVDKFLRKSLIAQTLL